MIHRPIVAPLVLSLVAGGTPAFAGYGYGGYTYYPQVYNNYYNTYPIRERVIQENLAPAYVFQVVTPGLVAAPAPVAAPVPAPMPVSAPMPMPRPAMPMPAAGLAPADLDRIAALVAQRLGAPPDEDVPPALDDAAAGLPQQPPAEQGPLTQAHLGALATSCYRCHNAAGLRTGERPRGGVALFDAQDRWDPRRIDGTPLDRSEVYEAVRSGAMPKGAQTDPSRRLDPAAAAALKAWAEAG